MKSKEGHPSGHNVHISFFVSFAPPKCRGREREGGREVASSRAKSNEGHFYQAIVHIILVVSSTPPKSREEVEVAFIRTRRDI